MRKQVPDEVNTQTQEQINQTAMLFAGYAGQIGCLILLIVIAALAAGVLLDKFLGTRAIFTILFVVGSFPVTVYVIMRVSLTTLARAQRLNNRKKSEDTTEE
jgi:F0F1-type ATP synthase assembly protein I